MLGSARPTPCKRNLNDAPYGSAVKKRASAAHGVKPQRVPGQDANSSTGASVVAWESCRPKRLPPVAPRRMAQAEACKMSS
eukprot:8122801-Pyramimonas_sp.AAC.1